MNQTLESHSDIVKEVVQLHCAGNDSVKYIPYTNVRDNRLRNLLRWCTDVSDKEMYNVRGNEDCFLYVHVPSTYFYQVSWIDITPLVRKKLVRRVTTYLGGRRIASYTDLDDSTPLRLDVVLGNDAVLYIDIECTKDVMDYHHKRVRVHGAFRVPPAPPSL